MSKKEQNLERDWTNFILSGRINHAVGSPYSILIFPKELLHYSPRGLTELSFWPILHLIYASQKEKKWLWWLTLRRTKENWYPLSHFHWVKSASSNNLSLSLGSASIQAPEMFGKKKHASGRPCIRWVYITS